MGTIKIKGAPDGQGREYSIRVSGQASGAGDLGGGDSVSGGTMRGSINKQSDTYTYTGEVIDADIPPGAALYIDGRRVDPATLGSSSSAPTSPTSTGGASAPTPTPGSGGQPTATNTRGSGMVAVLVAAVAAVAALIGGDAL